MKSVLLLVLLVALVEPIHAATIVPQPFPPAQFTSLYIEKGQGGTITSIQLAGDAVVYKLTEQGKVTDTVTVHPSGEDWFAFIQGLNSAKVYKWAPKYYYPGQGPSWVIDFTMADTKFTSEGTNEYPDEQDESKGVGAQSHVPTLPFQIFWQAALKLVGKAPATAK